MCFNAKCFACIQTELELSDFFWSQHNYTGRVRTENQNQTPFAWAGFAHAQDWLHCASRKRPYDVVKDDSE